MDDQDLRKRIDCILLEHKRHDARCWSRRIVLSSVAAAGLALGSQGCRCQRSTIDPVPPYAVQHVAETPDPAVVSKYAVPVDELTETTGTALGSTPGSPTSRPAGPTASSRPDAPLIDPAPVARYAVRVPRPNERDDVGLGLPATRR